MHSCKKKRGKIILQVIIRTKIWLSLERKLTIGIIADKIYYHLDQWHLLPEK